MNPRDIPLLMSSPMVRALRATPPRKSQTRRLDESLRLAKVRKDDRLWIRETWLPLTEPGRVLYRADVQSVHGGKPGLSWRPAIHMPRSACRLFLEATEDARREPLQAISETDAIAEGSCIRHDFQFGPHVQQRTAPWASNARQCFAAAIDDINGPGTWARDPEITVLTFHVLPEATPCHPPPQPKPN